MNISHQQKVLKNLKKFIVNYFNDESVVKDMQFFTGPEAIEYCEYASKDQPYFSFDCEISDFINYGYDIDNFKFVNALSNFLKNQGLYYEQGHHWNANIYEI